MDPVEKISDGIGEFVYKNGDDKNITSIYIGQEHYTQHRPQVHHIPIDEVNIIFGRYPEGSPNEAYQVDRSSYLDKYSEMDTKDAATVAGSQKIAEIGDDWVNKLKNNVEDVSVELEGDQLVVNTIEEHMETVQEDYVSVNK